MKWIRAFFMVLLIATIAIPHITSGSPRVLKAMMASVRSDRDNTAEKLDKNLEEWAKEEKERLGGSVDGGGDGNSASGVVILGIRQDEYPYPLEEVKDAVHEFIDEQFQSCLASSQNATPAGCRKFLKDQRFLGGAYNDYIDTLQ